MINGKCQIRGCWGKAKFNLYRALPGGRKKWVEVCDKCEREIGDENMNRAGGKDAQK